jgi:hypothetical protein
MRMFASMKLAAEGHVWLALAALVPSRRQGGSATDAVARLANGIFWHPAPSTPPWLDVGVLVFGCADGQPGGAVLAVGRPFGAAELDDLWRLGAQRRLGPECGDAILRGGERCLLGRDRVVRGGEPLSGVVDVAEASEVLEHHRVVLFGGP